MDITAERLAELRALLGVATPRPWEICPSGTISREARADWTSVVAPSVGAWNVRKPTDADAALIVAAVNALPQLLARADLAARLAQALIVSSQVAHTGMEHEGMFLACPKPQCEGRRALVAEFESTSTEAGPR